MFPLTAFTVAVRPTGRKRVASIVPLLLLLVRHPHVLRGANEMGSAPGWRTWLFRFTDGELGCAKQFADRSREMQDHI
jgi:hypothetical protein